VARETLEAVKQTEINAAKVESQASKEHDSILLRAEEKARLIISTKEKEVLRKSNEEMEKAKILGNEIVQNSIIVGNEENEKLIKKAKEKEEVAIELILSQII